MMSMLRLMQRAATGWWRWSDSNQQPQCHGTWFVSDNPHAASDTHPDRQVLFFCEIIRSDETASERTRD
jgi:hypothetical protein